MNYRWLCGAIVVSLLAACGGSSAPRNPDGGDLTGQFRLEVTSSGGGSGAVTSTPAGINCGSACSASFDANAQVTLTAAPSTGSTFYGWSGDCSGSSSTCVVSMTAAKSVTATFSPTTVMVTINVSGLGRGEVNSLGPGFDGCTAATSPCTAQFPGGGNLTVVASPGIGSAVGTWVGCDISYSGNCTITLTSDRTVSVDFPTTFVVTGTTPAEGATGVSVSDPVLIQFSAPVSGYPDTFTTNTADDQCSGNLQVSSDEFATCVRISSPPYSPTSGVIELDPASPLSFATTYKVRVVASASQPLDNVALPLNAGYTSATGFTTIDPFVVTATDPVEGATGVVASEQPSVTFNRNVAAGTVTVNTTDSTCGGGTVELSADDFNTCVQMSSVAAGGVGIVLSPAAPLNPNTTYKIRITQAVTDDLGNPLQTNFVSSSGFTTGP